MKDFWDKLEVAAKVLVPVVIAISVYSYNTSSNKRATAAQMAEIAVGILSVPAKEGTPTGDALRLWAIDVLKDPTKITPLSPDAAKQLEFDGKLLWMSPWSRDRGQSLTPVNDFIAMMAICTGNSPLKKSLSAECEKLFQKTDPEIAPAPE